MDFWRNEVFRIPLSRQWANCSIAVLPSNSESNMSFPGKLEQSRPRCDATLFCLFLLVFLSGFCIIAHFLSSPNFPSLFPIAQLLIIAKTLPSLPSFSRPTKTEGEWFCIRRQMKLSYADESLGVFFTKKKYSRFSDHKTSRKYSNFCFQNYLDYC